MKRVITFVLIIMFILCETVYVEGIGIHIDNAALEWVAKAETAKFAGGGVPLSFATDELNGYWVMLAYYNVEAERSVTIEEALTLQNPPCDLALLYDNYDNSIAFIFDRSTVVDIPQSVEVYVDGQLLKGKLNVRPEEVNDETSIIGFYFSMAEIRDILTANDAFMRLKTDKGTSFFELSGETMLVPWIMLTTVYLDTRFSLIGDACYLEKDILSEEVWNWKPQGLEKHNNLTVQLQVPQLTARVMSQGINLGWSEVDGAETFEIYRSVYGGEYELITTRSKSRHQYFDTSAPVNSVLYYYVCAKNNQEEVVSNIVSICRPASSIIKLKLTQPMNTEYGIELIWNSWEGAENYDVFRRDINGSQSFDVIGCCKETLFLDKTAQVGKTYEYYIAAWINREYISSNMMKIERTK